MKAAAIDIGTNSIRLLICESGDSSVDILERKMEVARIGKNLGKTGNISRQSAEAASDVLGGYKKLIEKHGVKAYRAVGTQALRKADNSDWFISYIKDNTGLDVEIITGRQEAGLGYKGVCGSFEDGVSVLVVDIGGGSTEFIMGDSGFDPELIESIDIGSVNLSERFIKSDIPEAGELADMHGFITDRIKPVIKKIDLKEDTVLAGVAGTITTIASIDLKLKEYDSLRIHHHLLTYRRVAEIYDMLCGLSLKERRRVRGLQPERADIIIGGTAVLMEVMDKLGRDSVTVSEQDILDGIIYSLLKF